MANQIKLTIDGIEVEVEKGKTILDAAQTAGVRIPTLCHDRRLVPFGACRVCVVQQKGKSDLLPACFTPARAGMEISTNSPEVIASRKLQLQLILLNHPMICPRCEKEGECVLQHLVYEYGVEETRYPWEREPFPVDEISPLLQRDPNKCILCGRCVRICDEVQGIGELSFTERGIKTSIDTDFHRPMNCEFCGQCLDTCPVGAITSDRFDYQTKAWELKETTTPCPYCGCGCPITFGSKDGEVKRVFSDTGKGALYDGPNDGNLCVKGRFGWDFIDHPDRLKKPLLRKNGALEEVSWEEALRFVAQELEEVKEQHGREAIAAIASSRLTNEEYFLFRKLFQEALGTDQIDHDGSETSRGLTHGLAKTLGIAASTNSIREIRKADCLLIVGTDPAQTHPIVKNEILLAIRQNRSQWIVLGYEDIGLTRAAHLSPLFHAPILLQGKPGFEVPVLNAMIRTILKQGWEDKQFIEEKTEGIEDLQKRLLAGETDETKSFSEGLKQEIDRAAKAFAQSKTAMILVGVKSWSSQDTREIATASSNLALTTGHLGKASCGILLLLEKCNSQGAIDLGIFPRKTDTGRKEFLQKTREGKLKALYLVGHDPLMADTDPTAEGMKNLRLLVVQNLFMTETAKMAHVVLPACAFVEKSGTYTSLERRVQKIHPFRSPLGESKSDFDIFIQLLRLLESPMPGETQEAVFEEIGCFNPYYKGIKDGEQWPKDSPYLYSTGFPKGKAKLIPVAGTAVPRKADGYPFQLIQRASLFQSGFLSSKSEALDMVSEEPSLELNPEDAEKHHVKDGETVHLSAPGGRSEKMKAKYSSKLQPGVVTDPYPSPLFDEGNLVSVKIERAANTKKHILK